MCVCVGVLPMYLSVYHVFAWCPRRPEKEADSLKLELQTGAATGCSELNQGPGSLEEQQCS